jgi:hypothetical protein
MSTKNNSTIPRKLLNFIGIALSVTLIVSNTSSIYGLLSTVSSVGNTGIVATANLGVYSNSGGTTTLSSINWGYISPGGNVNYTIYVKNTGTVPLTLSFTTGSWSPSGSNAYFTLTWNYAGSTINTNAIVPIILTLRVVSSVTGITSFSFQLTITGTQV